MKNEKKSLVQMIWIGSLLITDSSNFSNESLLQVIIHCITVTGDYTCITVCLFDLILYVPSTIFQLHRNRSSRVEPVLS